MRQHYYEYYFPDANAINAKAISRYREIMQTCDVRKTHFFAGRYENIYIDRDEIPALQVLIPFWITSAADVLDRHTDDLRCGFWFNEMGPGDVTQPHSHNDDDELLSGVYYLITPEDAGDLILHNGDERLVVQPEAGKLVLFSASNVHEVSENHSQKTRLSIGMNFGYSGND